MASSVNNNGVRGGGGAGGREPAYSTKVVKLPNVPAEQKLVIHPNEGVWDAGARHLGPTANSARVARFIEALKKENPEINSPARDFGNRVYAGDELRLPKGNWNLWSPPSASRARTTSFDQLDFNPDPAKVTQELQETLTHLEKRPALNATEKQLVASVLGRAERLPPEHLGRPDIKSSVATLRARLRDTDAA